MTPSELWVWLRRIRHCRGFGVQSPSAYAFIRYVVNEHYPYYAYAELRKAFPALPRGRRKLYELYMRLANHMQATHCHTNKDTGGDMESYVRAGCHHTSITALPPMMSDATQRAHHQPHPTPLMAIVEANEQAAEWAPLYLAQAPEGSVLVVEGIGQTAEAKALWHKVQSSPASSVCFDLHYCGIAFKDKRYKQSYIVNF